jgi:hypothetical protein
MSKVGGPTHTLLLSITHISNQPQGVVYQGQKDENNLTNGPQCKIDAAAIAELGANVVSVYSVDPTLNHDACMDAFSEHGIYVIVHMASPTINLNRFAPEYTKEIRNAFADVLDGFQKYDNLLAFFAGNEVIDDSMYTLGSGENGEKCLCVLIRGQRYNDHRGALCQGHHCGYEGI